MMRNYHGMRRIRRFFSVSPSIKAAGEKTTDEKAAEVGAAAWPTMKKYGILIVPGVLGLILTVLVVNEPDVRYSVEKYVPEYVNFLRKYYGFGSENLPEVRRIQALLHMQAQDYAATVQLANGQTITVKLSGSSEYHNSIRQIEEQYKSVVTHVDLDLANNNIDKVTTTNDEMNSDSSNCYRDRAAVSNMDSWHTKARGDPLPLRQRSHWQPPTSSSQSNTSSIDSPLYSQSSTIFNSTSTTPPNTTIYGGILPEEEPATHKILTRVAGQARGVGDYVFSDILGNRLCKLENYSTATRADLQIPRPLILEEMKPSAREKYVLSKSASTTSSGSVHSRESAMHIISGLELQIQSLKRERQIGARDMDEIEKDIRRCQDQITDLRRKHINYFYYF